jgi:6-phosphogluconolactonase (cycloisomerase 2 family)
LRENETDTHSFGAAEILISPKGNFIYISNRELKELKPGQNCNEITCRSSIAVFKLSTLSGKMSVEMMRQRMQHLFLRKTLKDEESEDVTKKHRELLTLIQHVGSGGQAPRHISFGRNGSLLLCVNELSHSIGIFNVDEMTGILDLKDVIPTSPNLRQPTSVLMVDVPIA